MKNLHEADVVTGALLEGAFTSFGMVGLAIPVLVGLLLAQLPTGEFEAATPQRPSHPQGTFSSAPIRMIETRTQSINLQQEYANAQWSRYR